ncbi:MAG: nickel pincer cofactor biosynthesis protein LarC [Armatimonadota bacterium]
MRLAYFDCFSGVSGDMTLAALVDAGASFDLLKDALKQLDVAGYSLSQRRVVRNGISAVSVSVDVQGEQHERHLSEIERLISASSLSDWVKEHSLAVFRRLAQAEADVHGTTVDKVHFHEVGGVDCIIDIVGSVVCLELLGVDEVHSSPLPTSRGFVECSHGVMPVPAPATMELLKGVPTVPSGVEGEMVTPTGAALVASLAVGFGGMPAMVPAAVGYGAGQKEFGRRPNLLRVVIGEKAHPAPEALRVSLLEANIDDMNPELYDHVMARLFAAGALDVYLTQVLMKKGRPAVLLTVVCEPEMEGTMADIVLAETSTLGVRISRADRICLQREFINAETPYGTVGVKIGRRGDEVLTVSPEYADCRRIAEEQGVPLKEVYRAAAAAVQLPPTAG